VDEATWLACDDLAEMLEVLRGRASERKARLFACTCVREFWHSLEERSRAAVEAAEAYADRALTEEELRRARESARAAVAAAAALYAGSYTEASYESLRLAHAAVTLTEGPLAPEAVAQYQLIEPWDPRPVTWEVEYVRTICRATPQGLLVREVFGNPFRPLSVDPAWLAWNGGAVVKLAQAAYDNRALPAGTLDPTRLAVLADALLDAGCTDTGILGHLREPGPHVRGCWALDVLLARR
jgi:hypothetical protein